LELLKIAVKRCSTCALLRFDDRLDIAHKACSDSGTGGCAIRLPAGVLSLGLPSTGGGVDCSCWLKLFGERSTTTELNIEVTTSAWAGAGVIPLIKIAAIVAVGVSKKKTRFMGLPSASTIPSNKEAN
jgi:hypothetical protein